MRIITQRLKKNSKGSGDLLNLTDEVAGLLGKTGLKAGLATVFVAGSTAAITTFEYEPGLMRDMRDLYEKIAPAQAGYAHDAAWGDANGFSHVRAALQGPSVTVPFENSKMLLGTWQQIVLAEFDNRPRNREIVVQFLGE